MLRNISSMLGMMLDDVAKQAEIKPLMRDSKTELIEDELYLTIPRHGIAFISPLDGHVSTVQLFAEGYDQYSQFQGELPEGISFHDSRRAVRDHLGMPDSSGGGEIDPHFGRMAKWDCYDLSNYSLHIEYADKCSAIGLVTLMRPDVVPD